VIGNQRHEEAEIPSKFWWAEGQNALDQDWASGDFSTSLEHLQWKAFGVTFALSGLLETLPFDRRGVTARSLSVAGNPAWISATAARQFAYNEGKANPAMAGTAVLEQAKLGFLTARAVLAQGSKGETDEAEWSWEAREWDVPSWFWKTFADKGSSTQDWASGCFSGKGRGPNGLGYITLHGVHFLKESLSALLPATVATAANLEPKNKGGRPPAAFADDLMCVIWGLIHQGDFRPKNQADIERAMLDWTERNGHELGSTAARGKARKVYAALTGDVENPSD